MGARERGYQAADIPRKARPHIPLNASTLDGSNADISACSREFSFCVIGVLQPSLSIRRWWSSPKGAADCGLFAARRPVCDQGTLHRVPARCRGEARLAQSRSRSSRGRNARRVGGSISKRGNVLSRLWPCFRAGHDNSLAFRFGHDVGVAAMPCLGLTLWLLRDIGRAISLVGDGEAGITALAHVGTRAWRTLHAARSR